MAIYEYRCSACGAVFEHLVRSGQAAQRVPCPHCGARRTQRLLSRFSSRVGGRTPRTEFAPPAPTGSGCGCGGCTCKR